MEEPPSNQEMGPYPMSSRAHREFEIDRLSHSADSLVVATKELRKAFAVSRWQKIVIGTMFLIITVLCCTVAFEFYQFQELSQNNRGILTTIKDCIDPAGECFKRSKDNQSLTVEQINKVTKVAAICSQVYNTENEISACIENRLK